MKVLLILVVLLPSIVYSQVDVDEYRRSVVEYSLTLKKASNNIGYYTDIYNVERANKLPSLSLSGDFSQQMHRQRGDDGWGFSLQPQVSQVIYKGGALNAKVDKAALDVSISELDADSELLTVCYTADYHYYNLMAIGQLRDAVAEYVEIIKSLREVVLLRYNEGYISKSDLLMIESRLSEAQYEQIAINEDYTIALQKFNVLRGFGANVAVEQADIVLNTTVLPYRCTIEELLVKRPDYQVATLSVDKAVCGVDLARSAYNPSLSVGASGNWHSHAPNVDGSTSVSGVAFVKLSVPIFHFSQRRKMVSASKILVDNSDLSLLEVKDAIILEENNMWATIVDSRAQLEASQKALVIGSENLEISTFSYSEGLTPILDVMQAQISWLQLYGNSIWAEFNYLISLAAYRRITAVDSL